ncbi:MAG: hypothetical protein D6726_01345 [Nitrospirae bacterium]|nr:MAG: hypothetical protein D6726_01345 [Nitrospirota bacterium]
MLGKEGYKYKIARPVIRGLFQRDRLFRLLDNLILSPVVWINGPPGAGKTSLIHSYLDKRETPAIWYHADEADSDIATFFYYMTLAVTSQYPESPHPLPPFGPEYRLDITKYARMFFDALYSRIPPPCLIIFENYQDVPAESKFHEILRMAMEMLPERLKIIVISRERPPEQFAKLMTYGAISTVEKDDLMFTEEELRGFIKEREMSLSDEDIHWILEQTEGWIGGILVLMEHLSRNLPYVMKAKPDDFDQIFSFFAMEVFQKIPGDIRDFLMKTSVFPEMTHGMAEAITGNPASESILSELERKNFFTSRLFRDGIRYRYHPLFRQFLINRLRDTLDHSELIRLKTESARLLELNGDTEDAIGLFIETGDWENSIRLITGMAEIFFSHGREQSLAAWINSIPEAVRDNSPWLLYLLGNCTLPYNPTEARALFERSYILFRNGGDRTGQFLSWTAQVNSVIFELDDCSILDPLIAEMEALLEDATPFPSEQIKTEVACAMFTALVVRNPGHSDIGHWEYLTETLGLGNTDINTRIRAAFILTLYRLWMGDSLRSAVVMDTLHSLVKLKTASPHFQLLALTTEAMYYWLTSSPELAMEMVQEGLSLVEETGVKTGLDMLLEHGAAAALSAGNIKKADEFLRKIRENLHASRQIDVGFYRYLIFWKALLEGDLATASGYESTLAETAERIGYVFGTGLSRLSRAALLSMECRYSMAIDALSSAREIAVNTKSGLLEFMCGIMEAYCYFMKGEEEKGNKSLKKVLVLGRKKGIVNFFGYLPGVMQEICRRALREGIEREYIRNLIRQRRIIPPSATGYIKHWPWEIEIEALGGFVLRREGEDVTLPARTPKITLTLLKALIAYGGEGVGYEKISDVLWPETDGDRAYRSFKSSLHRLRHILGNEGAVIVKDGLVTLNRQICYLDINEFEYLLKEAKKVQRDDPEGAAQILRRAIDLYKGHFLGDAAVESWAVSLRERLRSRYISAIKNLGGFLESRRRWEEAAGYYERGIETDELAEDFYRSLISCYLAQGKKSDALRVYDRCRETLSSVLQIEPSAETDALMKQIKG